MWSDDLMPYTAHGTGYRPRDTSYEAARSIEPSASTIRADVLIAIRKAPDGLTADECAEILNLSPLTVRPRFTELGKSGLIIATNEKRMNRSGRRAQVWACRANG
jgi:predicted ArsR family transcriptional regulator